MFMNRTTFNDNISAWEISNATDMSDLFFNANALYVPHGPIFQPTHLGCL